jgi:23S rRNA (adenine2503-C2)-methyltransferase
MLEKDLKNKTILELEKITEGYLPKFQATSIFQWIHGRLAQSVEAMTTLPKEARQTLAAEGWQVGNLSVVRKDVDSDGTIKYLFGLADGLKIESVVLDDEGRKTLCISSQVGCKMDCSFCATGAMKFKRNLTAAEIVDQVLQVVRDGQSVSNIVYMGMGEPLDNYTEVMKSVYMLNHPKGQNIGARHITISTCGIIPGILKLADENIQIRLAISLHAPTDAIREQIMPIAKKYPIADLIKAVKTYQKKTNRRLTFEYILLKDVNDSRMCARGLLKLINGIKSHINIIEYNAHSKASYESPSHKLMKEFAWILEDRGFEVSIRYKRGRSIKAACGQLGENAV